MNEKFMTFMKIACVIIFVAIIITGLFVYFFRDKSMYIEAAAKNVTYNLEIGDKFEFQATDKPSVGINHEEPIYNDKVVKYIGKSVDNQSKIAPGMTGGDKYVNTYKFEVIGKGESEIKLPMNYRGEISENSAEFKVVVE